MQTFVGLLVLSLALTAYGASLNSRVVGGTDAPEGKYPYQISIWINNKRFQCGGSILNERYILTAAHCVLGRRADEISVLVGSHVLSVEGERYQAEKLIAHKGFSFNTVLDDIALIRVDKDIVFADKIKPISLAPIDTLFESSDTVLTGWGRLWANGPQPDNLQQIDLKVISTEKCQQSHKGVTSKQVCTLTKYGEGACNGDSGGPLVANGVQVGVVSYGMPCAIGWPDVFTRVHSYLDWIAEHME